MTLLPAGARLNAVGNYTWVEAGRGRFLPAQCVAPNGELLCEPAECSSCVVTADTIRQSAPEPLTETAVLVQLLGLGAVAAALGLGWLLLWSFVPPTPPTGK